ncbi:MAG: adenosylcobinamide-GDP ribazoletransferase [Clostridia bacterium]|nr:adenosylcobinamide-GDP ribazoletransferase [Clostridia bacterium]
MKKLFHAMMMCFSMFCAIPCPYRGWDEDARAMVTLFLPLVGGFVGGLWTLLAFAMRWLHVPSILAGAILCAFPFLITGGIHIDGFMDVTDAVRSWRDASERRKILKDPHVGSFAVLFAILLVLTQFALFASAKEGAEPFALILVAVISRTVAGLCVTLLRPMSTSEYAGVYRKGIKKSHVVILAVVLAAGIAAGFLLLGKYGFVSVAVLGGYLLFLIRPVRSLKGMSGDVSGYAMTLAELCGIAVWALI